MLFRDGFRRESAPAPEDPWITGAAANKPSASNAIAEARFDSGIAQNSGAREYTRARDQILESLKVPPDLNCRVVGPPGISWKENAGSLHGRAFWSHQGLLARPFRANGMLVTVLPDVERAMDAAANVLYAREHKQVLVGTGGSLGPVLHQGFRDRLPGHWPVGFALSSQCDPYRASRCEAAVVQAHSLLWRTGTLVFSGATTSELSVTLLPRVQVVLAFLSDLRQDVEAWLAEPGFPSGETVVMVSGCSRTADIEKKLVLGVHGPWALHLFLIRGNQGDVS